MTRYLRILATLLIPACGSDSEDNAPLSGVIGGKPFTSISAALLDLPPDVISFHHEIMIGDFNLCRDLMSGEKPNSAYAMLYIPKTASTGTMPLGNVDRDNEAALAFHRLDAACDESTDEYADVGTVTITDLDGATIAGSISGAVAEDDPEIGDTNQISGSFEVSCELLPSRACTP